MSADEPASFEEALARLEEAVRRLESGELTLEESLRCYEEGMRLARYCYAQLDQAERRLERLTVSEDGRAVLEPFEGLERLAEEEGA